MSTIYHSHRKIKVSNLGKQNPLPSFFVNSTNNKANFLANLPMDRFKSPFEGSLKILPYLVQDNYDRSQKECEFPTIVLENSKLKATFYPQFGGRLASLYDKEKNKELLFDNPVFQPANLALRNAWFSGGIEWNGPIPGHTTLTCSPVYFAKVKINNQEILRIFEYDRILNTTWQIDFLLKENSSNLWYHVTARNLNKEEIPFYWWTNIAVPINKNIRFLTPTEKAHGHSRDELDSYPWPLENNIDISYPERSNHVISLFYLSPKSTFPWFSYVDENGFGLFHGASSNFIGKKLFYFGNSQNGKTWMDTLSLPNQGNYIEIQAGITDSQLSTTKIKGNSILQWTACIGPIQCSANLAHQTDYNQAVNHVGQKLKENNLELEIETVNKLMSTWYEITPDCILHEGEAWGGVYEKSSGTKIKGLLFTAPITDQEKPWYDLIVENNFSKDCLKKDPISWNVSDHWKQRIENSIAAGNQTWLHYLHLGVIALEVKDLSKAKEFFMQSNQLKNNFQALRGLAIIESVSNNLSESVRFYHQALQVSKNNSDLYLEFVKLLVNKELFDQLDGVLKDCPIAIENHDIIFLAKAYIALHKNQLETARKLIVREYNTIREGAAITTNIWFETFYRPEENNLNRKLTDTEKEQIRAKNPPPAIINFQMK